MNVSGIINPVLNSPVVGAAVAVTSAVFIIGGALAHCAIPIILGCVELAAFSALKTGQIYYKNKYDNVAITKADTQVPLILAILYGHPGHKTPFNSDEDNSL